MDIKDIFLQLTEYTTPQGEESSLEQFLPKDYKNDFVGNYWVQVGTPTTMFTSHLDNKCEEMNKVNFSFRNNTIRTDGSSILGADDKAGVSIMLNMIDNEVPGLYYFFIGEENKREGSTKLSKYLKLDGFDDKNFTLIDKVISFDRMGYEDIVTQQLGTVCCSDEFAKEISNRLNSFDFNYTPTKEGSYSDSYSFLELCVECTNISVGYFNEHLETEYQDIEFLEKLSNACTKIDWESLPLMNYSDLDSGVSDWLL